MDVLLLRHGVAEDGKPGMDDSSRALTRDGRAKLRLLLEQVAAAKVVPSLILSSPLLRAVQTAEVAARVLGYRSDILQTRVLEPGSSPEAVWEEIRTHRDSSSLLLVGHNPLFSQTASFLLDSPHLQIDFKKGALLKVEFEGFPSRPRGILRWYLTPKLTRSKD
jgi:phosphohistidine phosphatase